MPYRWTYVEERDRRQWLLKRNCALTPRQLAACFGALGVVSMAIAMVFASQGAWMVVPFACVEVAALATAFVVYARHAADYERILVTPGRLLVERAVGRKLDRVEVEPHRVRVEFEPTRLAPIRLVAGQRQVEVGRFVPGDRRGELARELRESLATARGW